MPSVGSFIATLTKAKDLSSDTGRTPHSVARFFGRFAPSE